MKSFLLYIYLPFSAALFFLMFRFSDKNGLDSNILALWIFLSSLILPLVFIISLVLKIRKEIKENNNVPVTETTGEQILTNTEKAGYIRWLSKRWYQLLLISPVIAYLTASLAGRGLWDSKPDADSLFEPLRIVITILSLYYIPLSLVAIVCATIYKIIKRFSVSKGVK